ncbi:hypothetical protein ZIOFF_047513 [Zingiber officinale]|uniref:dUTP diphosphatase n=1 Tax=Zingiber officinale TaxID=94328 RepID=A0A8J5G674_ZINOF|nr:hypothetical protein ZIOFF_047513 [Zingiber officinale]
MTSRTRPNITEAITTTETSQPAVSTQEDQIRSYRRMARLRYEAQRRLSRRQGSSRTLESQLNPEAELELSQQRRASLVPAETLYTTHWSEPRHRVYQHYSETRVLVTEGQQNLSLINTESYGILGREGMQLIHLGLVMIRIHALHRRNAGTNALIVLRDTRWNDDRSIIGTMEVDLSEGTQLVYIAPNLLISVEDFYHHIEIAIQTHGYEQWNSVESNLLITRGLIGRLTNTSHAGFRYNIQNVADYLTSTGINAVPATPRTTAELQGMRWILQPPNTPQKRNPQAVRTATLLDRSISLAFSGYRSTGNPRPSNYNERDTEDIHEEEFAGVFLQEFDMPDTNDRWDTLGEPTGRYNFYVNYAAPPPVPFVPPTKPCWDDDDDDDYGDDDEDKTKEEVVCPSIWEDTPWEDDPEFDPNELAVTQEEEDPESYYLGLQNQELDYPVLSPIQEENNIFTRPSITRRRIRAILAANFIDRIPEGIPPGVWYEIYENPEQAEYEIYNVPEEIHNEHLQAILDKQKGKSILLEDTDDSENDILPFSKGERQSNTVTFEFLKIKRLTPTARIPERRSAGAAGYDLFLDQNITIPAHDRMIVSTGISMEFPDNCYARITSRSGAAAKRRIDIGAGVIDADYRGEIKLLVLNNSNELISLRVEIIPISY